MGIWQEVKLASTKAKQKERKIQLCLAEKLTRAIFAILIA
jgi:hypothetical protein